MAASPFRVHPFIHATGNSGVVLFKKRRTTMWFIVENTRMVGYGDNMGEKPIL